MIVLPISQFLIHSELSIGEEDEEKEEEEEEEENVLIDYIDSFI